METKIIEIIKTACALEEEITMETELKSLSIDSLSFISVIVDIESEFGIEFDFDELNLSDWRTVGDIVEFSEKKLNGKTQN